MSGFKASNTAKFDTIIKYTKRRHSESPKLSNNSENSKRQDFLKKCTLKLTLVNKLKNIPRKQAVIVGF